ncbi:MAG: RIP metalloprotease RseP [Chitinivibrionales bacterium]|nr:RIP metalloprotease RseP [Chitinivibrionales bacterium]
MTNILFQIIVGLLILGILVMVHELGHFLAAKRLGFKVMAFSIGFGKALYTRKIGETEYRIGAIPFGGYVNMAGEHPGEEPSDDPAAFMAKPIYQRAIVAVAGPLSNFIFSFVVLYAAFLVGVDEPLYRAVPAIGAVEANSSAKIAGFRAGDTLVAINGTKISSWEDIERALARHAARYDCLVVNHGQTRALTLRPQAIAGSAIPKQPTAGLLPAMPARIDSITPNSPAAKSGLRKNDLVVAINGDSIHSWFELSEIITRFDSTKSSALTLLLRNHDSLRAVTVRPAFNPAAARYLIGVTPQNPPQHTVRYSAVGAIGRAGGQAWEYTRLIYDVFVKLFSHQVSPKQLAGPIGIVQMSGIIALGGLIPILMFIALIGINLAVLNLLPLIITDGGVLLFLLLEALRGRPLTEKSQMLINRIAVAFFIFLFVYVTFNDVSRIPQLFNLSRK